MKDKLIERLFAKSMKKQELEKQLSDVTAIANKYTKKYLAELLVSGELRMKNNKLQLFIEDNVSEEEKNKFFK